MMLKLSRLIVMLLLIFVSSTVFAVRVHSIYQAQVPVASQSEQKRSDAAKVGLMQVLIKVSGDSDIFASNPDLKISLNYASSWMQEYSYSSPHNAPNGMPHLLTMRFDPEAVNRLLREAKLPIWGQNRPLILVWLVLDGLNYTSDIVDSGSGEIPPILKQYATQRGLPIIFPVMDVTELSQVSTNDVTTASLPKLLEAAKRYGSDALLIGHVTGSENGLTSQWQLVSSAGQTNWNISENNLQLVFASVINNVADTLAKHYAIVTTDAIQSQVTLKVTGIKKQSELMRLMKYIQRLTSVADVQLKSVDGNDILFDVSLRSNKQSFIQSINTGNTIKPVLNGPIQDDVLVYQWSQ